MQATSFNVINQYNSFYDSTRLIDDKDLHPFQKINHRIVKINELVAKTYPPINKSTIIKNGIPAIANPNIYPYPQNRSFNAIITQGIIEVKIIDK